MFSSRDSRILHQSCRTLQKRTSCLRQQIYMCTPPRLRNFIIQNHAQVTSLFNPETWVQSLSLYETLGHGRTLAHCFIHTNQPTALADAPRGPLGTSSSSVSHFTVTDHGEQLALLPQSPWLKRWSPQPEGSLCFKHSTASWGESDDRPSGQGGWGLHHLP